MNKMFLALVVLSTLGLALPMANGAHACDGVTTSDPELDTTRDLGVAPLPTQYYVDHDAGDVSIWIYEEANGLPGLQRGDTVKDDTCHMIPSDTIIL